MERKQPNLEWKKTSAPCVALENTTSHLHYAFPDQKEITLESLRAWTNKFLNGQMEPTMVSEEIPESNEGPVKVVVGKNFKDIVMNENNDVILEVYAPWCGHCKKLKPTWDALGEALKDVKEVTIAKMDGTVNDLDAFLKEKLNKYPTILMFKANDKKNPIPFNKKERDVDGFINWIKEVGSVKFDIPKPVKDEL